MQFTDPTDGTTLLDWYLEVKSDTVGVAHLKVPTLTAGQAALPVARMYVGNAAAADLSDEAGVYSALGARYGLSEVSGTIHDSTANSNHSIDEAGISYNQTGQIGPCTGHSSDAIGVASSDSLQGASISVSAWIKTSVTAYTAVICKSLGAVYDYALLLTPAGGLQYQYANNQYVLGNTPSVNDDSWHHVGVTASGSQTRFFVDGVWYTRAGGAPQSADLKLGLGGRWGGSSYSMLLVGMLDEVRILAGTWTPARMTAEYMAGAGTLFSYGGWVPALDLAGSVYGIGMLGGRAQLVQRLEGAGYGLGMAGGWAVVGPIGATTFTDAGERIRFREVR